MDAADTQLADALRLARRARTVEVFTGAGMSAESGLVTFRDKDTGLWSKVDPAALASIESWAKDPEPMWAWYLWRSKLAGQADPNAGHRAIGEWGELDGIERVGVTTQNIDNLHERGGVEEVIHLHGSLFDYRCSICSRPWEGEVAIPDEPVERMTPPSCPLCGDLVRPGVVWFGEALPQREWSIAEQRMREADLVVIVGTSGIVQPAASLPLIAAERGTPLLEISPEETELSRFADVSWRTTAAAGLPELVMGMKVDGLA